MSKKPSFAAELLGGFLTWFFYAALITAVLVGVVGFLVGVWV